VQGSSSGAGVIRTANTAVVTKTTNPNFIDRCIGELLTKMQAVPEALHCCENRVPSLNLATPPMLADYLTELKI
jgi:hypothetical protein